MITLWGRRSSSNVQAVLWCLNELKIPYKRIDAGFVYGVINTPEYLGMNPNGKVPTIKDGDNPPLWESGAILRYLSRTYADEKFWPNDPLEQTMIDMWAEWAKLNVASKFTGSVFWPMVRIPEIRRDTVAVQSAVDALDSTLAIADARLAGQEFLATCSLTMADVQLGHVLYRYYDVDIVRANLKHLRLYYERLMSRPTYADHVMVSYEELRDSM